MVTIHQLKNNECPIAVIGLGYVGLPLVLHLARHFSVIGFDINAQRIHELLQHTDHTKEVCSEDLRKTTAVFSSNATDIAHAGVLIIAVPTPVDECHAPDFTPLISATKLVAQNMSKHCVVVYESTVYPGATEEICIPLLEHYSGLTFGVDFTVGYSPERINPGDEKHTLESIVKVVSGSDTPTLELLSELYETVVLAGTHKAPSIKVAEAAKVIENTQRDLNIALMNELALIFNKLNIDTLDVLKAAGTKWNFLPFRPGLVGGHCIGVDPYYLTQKAESVGYQPQVILAGRRINDSMGTYIADTCIKLLSTHGFFTKSVKVGILGVTFKENVSDLRNTRVIDIITELKAYNVHPLVHDPIALAAEAETSYGITLTDYSNFTGLHALILAVPHKEYLALTPQELKQCLAPQGILMDVKSCLDPQDFSQNVHFWRL